MHSDKTKILFDKCSKQFTIVCTLYFSRIQFDYGGNGDGDSGNNKIDILSYI